MQIQSRVRLVLLLGGYVDHALKLAVARLPLFEKAGEKWCQFIYSALLALNNLGENVPAPLCVCADYQSAIRRRRIRTTFP